MDKWIFCRNGTNLPALKEGDNDASIDVLVFFESDIGYDDLIVHAFHSLEDEEWYTCGEGNLLDHGEVTHWLPLPPFPNLPNS